MVVNVLSVRQRCHRKLLSCSHSQHFVHGIRNQRTSRGFEKPNREGVNLGSNQLKHRKMSLHQQRSQRLNRIRNQRQQHQQNQRLHQQSQHLHQRSQRQNHIRNQQEQREQLQELAQ